MRTVEEILKSKKVILTQKAEDGFSGLIYIRGWEGTVIASWGGGWEHVSVSPRKNNYTPTWDDMCAVKDLFWNEEEAVIQIHPAKSEYVNNKKNCLHLWRSNDKPMLLPPSFMVGIKEGQTMADIRREMEIYYKENGYKL